MGSWPMVQLLRTLGNLHTDYGPQGLLGISTSLVSLELIVVCEKIRWEMTAFFSHDPS